MVRGFEMFYEFYMISFPIAAYYCLSALLSCGFQRHLKEATS